DGRSRRYACWCNGCRPGGVEPTDECRIAPFSRVEAGRICRDRGSARERFESITRFTTDIARALGTFAADGREAVRAQHRGSLSRDVADLVRCAGARLVVRKLTARNCKQMLTERVASSFLT